MICEQCHSAKATVHITDIAPGEPPAEKHLCIKCGESYISFVSNAGPSIEDIHSLSKMFNEIMLGALAPGVSMTPQQAMALHQTKAKEIECEDCGNTFGSLAKDGGKIGCSADYEAFKDPLDKLVPAIQDGATQHVGKVPRHASKETCRAVLEARIMRFEKQLRNVIRTEEYERAAEIRDQIEAVKTEMDGGQ